MADESNGASAREQLEADAEGIKLWIEVATGMELDPSGMVLPLDEPTWRQRWQRLEKRGGLSLR